jgi:hypothetical protein
MTKKPEIDMTILGDMKEHALDLKAQNSQRDVLLQRYDDMYMMRLGNQVKKKKADSSKVIISPDARNRVLGALRLMTATGPDFKVTNEGLDQAVSEKLGTAVKRIWEVSGRQAGVPIHHDALLSALLYSEMHMVVNSTADLVKRAEDLGYGQDRAGRVAEMTPYLVEAWNPREGYPEFDRLGVSAYYRYVETTIQRLRDDWGKELLPVGYQSGKGSTKVYLNLFYDLKNFAVWTDAGPIWFEEHGLPDIPVRVQITDGSRLWTKPEEQRQPLLYSLAKSNIWDMHTMLLSVIYTVVHDMGVTPLYVHTAPPNQPDKTLVMDFDDSPGVVELETGEQFVPVTNKGLIDPAVQQALQITEQMTSESTLYPQALGAPMAGNTTFSELSLLSQSGRLPLMGPKERGGWGIASVAELILSMWRSNKTRFKGNGINLKISDIPKYAQFDVSLEVKLPQDQLQMANIATLLQKAGLADDEWIQTNILGIDNPSIMRKRVWTQQASQALAGTAIQQMVAEVNQVAQQQLMAGAGGPGGPTNPGLPAGPGEIPTEAGAGGPPQMPAGPMPGNPGSTMGGLPAAQGGLMPGSGNMANPGGA